MGMFDEATVFQPCPKCKQWITLNLQTKDLDCLLHHYRPLPNDWFTNQATDITGGKKFRKQLPVFPKVPKDKEHKVWKNQAEREEMLASLAEPYASQLKFVNFYGSCPECKACLEGKIRIENGMLIGYLLIL